MNAHKCVVVGAGAFGTALAAVIAQNGHEDVTLLGRDRSLMADLALTRQHEAALPGIDLPANLRFSADRSVLAEAGIVLFVMPSQAQSSAAVTYAADLAEGAAIVTCAKGIDRETTGLLSHVLERRLPGHPIAVLSGPGFAADIARGLPTAMSIAAPDMELAEHLARSISGRTFRLYASDDPVGVQLGGAAIYHGQLEQRPPLGAGPAPVAADLGRAIALIRHSLWLWLAAFFVIGFLHA